MIQGALISAMWTEGRSRSYSGSEYWSSSWCKDDWWDEEGDEINVWSSNWSGLGWHGLYSESWSGFEEQLGEQPQTGE